MIYFLLGAAWVIASIVIGMAAGWWLHSRNPHNGGEAFRADLLEIDKNATAKFTDLSTRIGSLESKVNLLTAFRPKGEAK